MNENRKLILDSLSQVDMGMGGIKDKLQRVKPQAEVLSVIDSENWYEANGFIQRIVDIPAEDATREWITIKTNREDLNISRLIQNRLVELDFPKKLKELIRYSRMYNMGGFLYFGIDHAIPQTDVMLNTPIPQDLNKIEFVNVFTPLHANILTQNENPLSKEYQKPKIRISGIEIHESRFYWLVNSYIPNKNRGISIIQTLLDGAKAHGIALWSVTTLLSELSVKVFKSPQIDNLNPDKTLELLNLIRTSISTQGVFAANNEESFERLNVNLPHLKDIFDFLIETISGLSQIPKSRLLGQAQGTITGGQYDLVSYYDSIAKFQEIELRPILERVIGLVIRERSGQIYRTLGESVGSLDWEFKFNPLWKLSDSEQSDIYLKQAQADKIYIESAVLSPNEVRKQRFEELETFQNVTSESLSLVDKMLSFN